MCYDSFDSKIFSIVIPTFNEEIYIGRLVEHLLDLQVDNFQIEVIVIDNGSTDKTLFILENFPCTVKVLPGVTIAEMRNYGAGLAIGKWLGFVDADCFPVNNWAVLAKQELESDQMQGVVGSFYSLTTDVTWVELLWYSMRSATVGNVNFLPAGNMAVRHCEFLQFGGFPRDAITGEDYALCERYISEGYSVVNNPKLKSMHYGNVKTLSGLFRKELWYGLSFKKSYKKNMLSKVFWATIVFLSGCLMFNISLISMAIGNVMLTKLTLFFGLLSIIFVVVPYACIATIRSRTMMNFFGYIMIFFVYFLGRSAAVAKLSWSFLFGHINQ
ncbi:MAG: glycosyltransferase [Thermodesulfobacteriota bacterium]|nr:glycosyltransferase [Thermodesulfobacteriota bacterium]